MSGELRTTFDSVKTLVPSDKINAVDLGTEFAIDDVDYTSTDVVKRKLTGHKVGGKFVQSTESDALLPGQLVRWDAAAVGTKVKRCGASDVPCGVVPLAIASTGVPATYGFYMFDEGPVTVISNGAGVIAAGDEIIAVASGKTAKRATSWANEAAVINDGQSLIGQAIGGATNVDGTKYRVLLTRVKR